MAVPQRGFEEVAVEPVPLGRYILLDPIAQARTGVVYRACVRREGKPDELLAIKRISADLSRDARFAECFVAVMGRAAQLEHAAHCAIEDVDHAPDGSLFVAMEWVEGKDLAHIVEELNQRGQNMPPQLVAHIGAQLADALAAAHAMTRSGQPAPLYHGELALEDILIGYDGRVRLTGLGTAALGTSPPRVGYRAPELARGAACSAHSDVFSLGACLYELLSGRPAVVTDPHSSASGPMRRPESHITKVVPRPLEQVVSRALADQPEARWDGAAELGRALQRWSSAQPARSDSRALAMFMIALFDDAIAEDDARLRAWLARVPPARPQTALAPAAPSALDARHSYARLVRASIRPAPSATAPDWTSAAENTPARGVLMEKLAAEMIVEAAPERASAKPAVPAARMAKPVPAPADLPFPDLGDESWDEHSSAHAWISKNQHVRSAQPPSPALDPPPVAAKPVAAKPVAAKPPAPAVASLATKPPPFSSRPSTAASQPVPAASQSTPVAGQASRSAGQSSCAGSEAARVASQTSRVAARPSPVPAYSRPPLPLAPGALALPAPVRAARPRWVTPAVAAAALGLLLGAVALLSGNDPEPSTVYIRTRPAGAEVFLRGQPIGFAPLKREQLPSGDATVELRAPGFQTATRAIQLEPGKVLLLDVDLVRHVAPAAAPTTPAAQQADLQAQLAAARQVERRAEPGEVNRDESDDAFDHETRRRRSSGGHTDSDPEPPASEAEAAPALDVEPAAKADVRLEPRGESTPAAVPAAQHAAVAPSQSAPAQRTQESKPSSGVTRPAALITQSTPRFPARARRMGISQGTVTIEFTIDRSGAVKNASVVKANPPGLFDETALREIQKWKYRPKLENGAVVETRQRFTFRFSD